MRAIDGAASGGTGFLRPWSGPDPGPDPDPGRGRGRLKMHPALIAFGTVAAAAAAIHLVCQTLEAVSSDPVHACRPGRPAALPLADAVVQTGGAARAEGPWGYAVSIATASCVLASEEACGDVSLAVGVRIGRTGRGVAGSDTCTQNRSVDVAVAAAAAAVVAG